MKRILICLLAALLLASCTQSPVESDTENTNTDVILTEEETAETYHEAFKIREEDNNGKTVTFLSAEHMRFEHGAFEMTGEVVNDAVYKRNLAVEELLGISFDFVFRLGTWAERLEFCETITNSILADDGAYDIVSGQQASLQMIAYPQWFLNVYDIPDINLDNPWWMSAIQDDLTINGKLVGFMGDISLSTYSNMDVMYANMTHITNIGMEDPYTMVKEGRWTLDKMIEQTTEFNQDLNGDGSMEDGVDLFGIAILDATFGHIQAALDIEFVNFADDGSIQINPLSDKVSAAIDKIYVLSSDDGMIFKNSFDVPEVFANDQAIYLWGYLESASVFREMESDYMIIPFPKFDEDQKEYLTPLAIAAMMIYIPTTNDDVALTGKVCESLSYFGYKEAVPAYYEVALKAKYIRDEKTKEMLDIIRDGVVFNMDFAYSQVIGNNAWPTPMSFVADTAKWYVDQQASTFKSVSGVWENNCKAIYEEYE